MDYDARTVPVFPVLRLELNTAENGNVHGFLNDVEVIPEPGQTPRDALISAVARQAGERPGKIKAYRVRGSADGTVFHLVVDSHGNVEDITPHTGMKKRTKIAFALAGVGVCALAGSIGYLTLSDDKTPTPTHTVVAMVTPQATATEAAQEPPLGFSDRARWASDPVPAEDHIATTQNTVFTLVGASGQGEKIAALNVASGKTVWSANLPNGFQPTSGPSFSTIEGKAVLTLAASDRVMAYDLAGNQVTNQSLDTQSSVTILPEATLLVSAGHARILTATSSIDRVLPPNSAPYGVQGTTIIAADQSGKVWSVTNNQTAPNPITLSAPKGQHVSAVLGMAGGHLITVFSPAQNSATFTLAACDPHTGKTVWATKALNGDSSNYAPSPHQKWATLGGYAVDLTTGTTQALPNGWQQLGISDDFVWGQTGNSVLTLTHAGLTDASKHPPTVTDSDQAGTPLGSAGGIVLMSGQQGQITRLYALAAGK